MEVASNSSRLPTGTAKVLLIKSFSGRCFDSHGVFGAGMADGE
jgi:hypothetical protein